MNEKELKDYIREQFKVAIYVEPVMPSDRPKGYPADKLAKLTDDNYLVSHEQVAVWEMVSEEWFKFFPIDEVKLFRIVWDMEKRLPRKIIAKKYGVSITTIRRNFDKGIEIIINNLKKGIKK